MKIIFETTGGFAGLTTAKTIDSDKLPADQATSLRQQIAASNFFSLPATIAYSGPARDTFQYKLIIELEGKEHTVVVDELAAPPELESLIKLLRTIKP